MSIIRSDIYENVKMAFATLRANKLRSALTVVGVVIGVWTVMAIASIISGVDVAVKKEVESWGTRTIQINKYDSGPRHSAPSREERLRPNLNYDDAQALARLPSVELAIPFLDITNDFWGRKLTVGYAGKTSSAVRLEGTLPDYERAGTRIPAEGRWFTEFENNTNKEVCIIGSSVAENFFPYRSAVGENIEIGARQFRITGVLMAREQFGGGDGGSDVNNIIFVPFSVARKLKPDAEEVSIFAVGRAGQMEAAVDEITDTLRLRRNAKFGEPNNFGLETAESSIKTFREIMFGVTVAIIGISSVGLMVGGVGVMNIMLVSVTERTKEIGTRKAIGARRRDILWQFLIEAATLTGVGGVIGLALGWLTSLLIRLLMPSYVPLWAPIGGFIASVSIGLIFGLYPAWKAARLNPIEALRYE